MSNIHTVHGFAENILSGHSDPVIRNRILRDVLHMPGGDRMPSSEELEQNHWVKQLAGEQWEDGSWGRLHSQDSRLKQKIPTTEAGVERGLALGLDIASPVLLKASLYLEGILTGKISCRDPAEKNDRWTTGVSLFAGSTLSQIRPDLPVLDELSRLWITITERTFESGAYDPDNEILAHRELTGASVKNSYLVISNKYALTMLGSRIGAFKLPGNLESVLLSWVWRLEKGIGYLGVPLWRPPALAANYIDRWFTSLELLSRFPGWRAHAGEAIPWIWKQQGEDGFWDFGPLQKFAASLPLSEPKAKRKMWKLDWTTRVLVLLGRFYAY